MTEIVIAVDLTVKRGRGRGVSKAPRSFSLERIERARRAVAHYRKLCDEAEERLFELTHPQGLNEFD